MAVISSQLESALPPPVAGIDVNFCKNPSCRNFGISAFVVKFRRKAGTALAVTPGTSYVLAGTGKRRPGLKCMLCGETFSVKSNLAVAEEAGRFADYLLPKDPTCCQTAGCANALVPLGTREAYQRFGVTAAGTPRWRCRACGKTLAIGGRALKRQRVTHLNKSVLLALTNKVPMRRICKITGIAPATLYAKIDFLHRQAVAYAASRELALRDLTVPRLYISVDRQDYSVNWAQAGDRRNIVLRAVGSADNASGYVFGMHLAFDPSLDPVQVEKDAKAEGDSTRDYPARKYARLWLQQDYVEALAEAKAEKIAKKSRGRPRGASTKGITTSIDDAYIAVEVREDSEVSDLKAKDERLPERRGMQVHEEYSLYGHFHLLRALLRNVGKLRLFLDQDSGIRAACFAAFAKDIIFRRVDAFYVRIAKEMTVAEKRGLVTTAAAALKKVHDANPNLSPAEVQVLMMESEIAGAVTRGKWSDRWCTHPAPDMREPDKAICWLTDQGDYDLDHQARLYLKASLGGIDNFFQRVRRSLNPLERPGTTPSKGGRTWYGYSPYNPVMVTKLLDIYRVMHNFVEAGKDHKTPAMRLGIATVPATPEDIIYFPGKAPAIPDKKRRTGVSAASKSTR